MNQLKKHKLSALYEMGSGISSKPEQAGHGAPFCSYTTVFNDYFLPPDLPDLMDTSLDVQESYSIREGDILLTRTSETLDALGMSCVALKDYPSATFSGFLKRLRPIQSKEAYPKFMAFYMRSKLFRKAMDNNAVMTLRCSLNENIFSYLEVLLPDYDVQVNIGDLLYLGEAKIKNNERISAELDQLVNLLYGYWFMQFDFPISAKQAADMGDPSLQGKPYHSSGGPMQFNEILKRDIPRGWKDGDLEELGEIVGGSTPNTARREFFTQDGTPWITPRDLSENTKNRFIAKGANDVTPDGIKDASLKTLPAGTVLLSSRAPIGYLAIARNPVTTNQGFKSFLPTKGYSSDFVYCTLKHFMKLIKANASGSTFKEISGSTLKVVKIHLPDTELARRFSECASSISAHQSLLEQQNEQLVQFRDWLLPMLMNGQVTVS